MSVKLFSASGYQNECKVQAAWLNAFCAAGLHEIGKLTSSTTGPSPAPGGAAAARPSARADDHSGSTSSIPTATIEHRRRGVMAVSPQPALDRQLLATNVRELPAAIKAASAADRVTFCGHSRQM